MTSTGIEPLVALRRHAADAPWALGELAALADTLLESAGHGPPRATSERTVRFYVGRGVVRPPFGRGPGSTWGYPHLVELLAARLAQEAGESLDAVGARRRALDDDAVGRYDGDRLDAVQIDMPLPAASDAAPAGAAWQRYPVTDGLELHLAADHPLVGDPRRLGALIARLAREAASPAPES